MKYKSDSETYRIVLQADLEDLYSICSIAEQKGDAELLSRITALCTRVKLLIKGQEVTFPVYCELKAEIRGIRQLAAKAWSKVIFGGKRARANRQRKKRVSKQIREQKREAKAVYYKKKKRKEPRLVKKNPVIVEQTKPVTVIRRKPTGL